MYSLYKNRHANAYIEPTVTDVLDESELNGRALNKDESIIGDAQGED
jgi:hypothetical protein